MILVIDGHPRADSLCAALADRYASTVGAASQSGETSVVRLCLRDLDFNLHAQPGFRVSNQVLEPDLLRAQELIRSSSHIVWIYPNWWGTYPALVKGFLDRVFIPGFAFAYHPKLPLARRLLKGRTTRLIVTMDGPGIWYWLLGKGGDKAMCNSTLRFCGLRVRGVHHFGSLRGWSRWIIGWGRARPDGTTLASHYLEKISRLARRDAQRDTRQDSTTGAPAV